MKKIISFIFILTFIFSCTGTAFADYIEIEEGSRGCVTSVLDGVGTVTETVCDSLFGRPRRVRVIRTIEPYAFERYPAPIPDGYVMTSRGYAVPIEQVQPQVIEQNIIIQNDNNNEQVQVQPKPQQVVNKTYKTYKTYKNTNCNPSGTYQIKKVK